MELIFGYQQPLSMTELIFINITDNQYLDHFPYVQQTRNPIVN